MLIVLFLLGMLAGGLIMWGIQEMARQHVTRPHVFDTDYAPAKRAVVHHLRVHGTLNLVQLERMLSVSGTTALRYLDQMVHDGLLKQQGHRTKGAFYTLA